MKIALLGSIPKDDEIRENWHDWRQDYTKIFIEHIPRSEFLSGDEISDNAGAEMVVGHDLSLIKRADVCVVDARDKIGAGTSQEILVAKYFTKPVVIVIPKNSHYRKSDVIFHGVKLDEWVHPFLKITTDYIAESIQDAAEWVNEYFKAREKFVIKDFSVLEAAIGHFEKNNQK